MQYAYNNPKLTVSAYTTTGSYFSVRPSYVRVREKAVNCYIEMSCYCSWPFARADNIHVLKCDHFGIKTAGFKDYPTKIKPRRQ